ncbi:MAG TPA: rhomboid family intramembrane serine protease [Lachnospiraceae bacterium]|nr:rhomboid family intramembrane serine protease [Lachnospiraceae bacterium]
MQTDNTAKKRIRITFNSPVILSFVGVCLLALILDKITGGISTLKLFSVYRSSFLNPLTYVRLIGHIFGHAGWSHFINNIMMILILGPMLEEKYGSKDILLVILITAVVTGAFHMIFSPFTRLLGASGVVFAFILLLSLTSFDDGGIPVTFILVAVIYIGEQIYQLIAITSNVSNITHIIGGAVGATFGFVSNKLMHTNK